MVIKGRLKPEKESYYQQQIQNAFPDNFFEAPPEIISAMTNAETDRHVAATAIISQAQYIVTFNLKDFPEKALNNYNIEAIHPDQFLLMLCDM
jgi:predicted nucleic acid-binding protein